MAPIPSFCHHSLYKAQVERCHFKEKSALLITGICCLHLLEVAPHAYLMVCIMESNHPGVSPAHVGLGRFQFNVIQTV